MNWNAFAIGLGTMSLVEDASTGRYWWAAAYVLLIAINWPYAHQHST